MTVVWFVLGCWVGVCVAVLVVCVLAGGDKPWPEPLELVTCVDDESLAVSA